MVQAYIRKFTRFAMEQGLSRLAFYLEEKEGRSVSVYQGSCDKLEYFQQAQLFVEGEYEGFCGSVFVENFDESLMREQVDTIKETAIARKKLFVPYEYPLCPETEGETEWLPLDQMLEKLAAAEKTAYELDKQITTVQRCVCHERKQKVTLLDHQGHSVSDHWAGGNFFLGVSAKQEDQVQLGGKGKAFLLNKEYPDFSKLAEQGAERAVSKLGSGSYRTGNCPVLLEPSVVCQLLDAFMPTFFAKNIQNHMSVLEGKTGQMICGENICLYEAPQLAEGLVQRRFDDEGVLTTEKTLIQQGKFRTCLYNRQSAASEGISSGGNGFKASFSDEADTGYTNIVLQPGTKTQDELQKELGNGLLIDDVSGVFAGANPVSGDFSLIAKGYRVENGCVGKGVTKITVAGNFFDLLCHVKALGSELEAMDGGKGCVFCPALLVEKLMISGEELDS